MSDVEEPPTKVTKIEIELSTEQNVSMESSVGEGQEEWLSESVMTDEDYNTSQDTSAQETTQDISQEVSQETTHFADETNVNETHEHTQELSIDTQVTKELADDEKQSDQLSPTFTQDMGIVHDDEQNNDANNPEPTQEETTNQEDTAETAIQNVTDHDQNVTEAMETEQTELMNTVEATLDKMEHEDEPKGVEVKREQDLLDDLDTFLIRKPSNEQSSDLKNEADDDGHNTDELLEMLGEDEERKKKSSGLKTVSKKATLAAAESSDDDTFQGNETRTLKLAKNAVIKRRGHAKAFFDSDMSSDEASSSAVQPSKKHVPTKTAGSSLLKTQHDKKPTPKLPTSTSTPLRTYGRSRAPRTGLEPRSLLKPSEEHDSNEEQEVKEGPPKQRIMKPEEMEEEAAFDSDQSDESFYDDLPSSDSEDVEEWFALDVRAELAGDYIPLLGYRAYDILTEEKKRVSKKLEQLREGLNVLNESTKRNMKEIEITRRKLDELEGELSLA